MIDRQLLKAKVLSAKLLLNSLMKEPALLCPFYRCEHFIHEKYMDLDCLPAFVSLIGLDKVNVQGSPIPTYHPSCKKAKTKTLS